MVALSSFRLQLLLIAASFSIALLFVIAFSSSSSSSGIPRQLFDRPRMEVRYSLSRKLLSQGATANPTASTTTNPNRIGDGCSPDDIVIYQSATAPLPNGIPTYTVQVLNECIAGGSGCRIGRVHLSCRWFSSARLVNPRIFRRLRYDDCLVNDGLPIAAGQSVSFQYANSFPFPMSVSSADCLS